MADTVTNVNDKIISVITSLNFLKIIGWVFFAALVIGGSVYGYWWWRNKRLFNKKITAFEIVGGVFIPTIRDTAKTIKIGTGGFEILYLKKCKTWKVAHGGKVGYNDYYFFIMPDGYWYNGLLSADIKSIDKNGGYIPIVITNPSMRAQYTSLEKQIDSLHAEKKNWFDKWGAWVMGISFVLVAGVMLWLNYREFAGAMGSLSGLTDKLGTLIDRVNNLMANTQTPTGGGLTPV